MRILKAHEYRRMPWRNNQGETAQVAIGPATATLNDFDWRVSMARIDDDGPFSLFPQTDRTLAVLRGDGLHLSIAGNASVELTRHSEPLSFKGDVAAAATLIGGTVTDLNVMTRRGHFKHSMRRLHVAGDVELTVEAPLTLLVCAEEAVHVKTNTQIVRLSSLDSLLLDEAPTTMAVSSDILALVYLIEIHGTAHARSAFAPPDAL
jgi:environmental stress-induced protein Ves